MHYRNLLFLTFFCISVFGSYCQNKHQFGFSASAPWVNNYRFYNYETQRTADKSGFIGLGLGTFYKNGANRVSVNGQLTLSTMLPFGEPEYAPGSVRDVLSAFGADVIFHRQVYKKLSVFAGPAWMRYWFRLNSDNDSFPSYNKFDNALGIATGIEYQAIKSIAAAIVYRPSLYSINRKQYWHVLSISARFDLYLRKRQ